MLDRFFNSEYMRIYFSVALALILGWPYAKDILTRETTKMVDGLKGENSKWDASEIWEHHALRVARGSFIIFVFMVIMKTVADINYSWELYVLSFMGTAGSNGLAAFLIYNKNKS